MGKIQVTICAARNLYDNQVVSLPDPYCRIRLGDKHYKTKVIDNNLNPAWNETFRFQVADENSAQLCLELWNKNIISDDIMGTYILSLSGLSKGVVKDEWYLLAHSKTNAEVRVRLLACDFGSDPKAEDRWKVTADINNDPVVKSGAPPPASTTPATVTGNKMNTPIASNTGPAVVPMAAAPLYQPPPMQPMQPMPPAYYAPQPQAPMPGPYYATSAPPPPTGYYPPPPQQQQQPGYYYPPQQQQQPAYYPPQPQGYYPPPQQPPQMYPATPADPNYRY